MLHFIGIHELDQLSVQSRVYWCMTSKWKSWLDWFIFECKRSLYRYDGRTGGRFRGNWDWKWSCKFRFGPFNKSLFSWRLNHAQQTWRRLPGYNNCNGDIILEMEGRRYPYHILAKLPCTDAFNVASVYHQGDEKLIFTIMKFTMSGSIPYRRK